MSDTKISEAALILDRYDTGLLGDGGGGDVNWWWDYIRSELDRAHEFYQDQADHLHPQPAELAEQQGLELPSLPMSQFVTAPYGGPSFLSYTAEQMRDYARSALAATGKQQVVHAPVDFYVCDSCDHYYMEDGVICDCTALAKQPPLRHVRMVAATGQQVGEVQVDARAQFEAWAASRFISLVQDAHYSARQYYAHNDTEMAWQAWQAALAARQPVCGTCATVIQHDALTGTTCECARQPGAQETGIDGYQRAFYELASMMGMTAQPISPKEVWETQMRPMLREMISKNQHQPDVPFEAPTQPEGSREEAMVVLDRDESGRPTVWCDPGVVDLVAALNGAGIATTWSCDGHGHRPATVGLKDGRQLLVLESLDALASISHLWPDINGNHSQPEPIGYANLHHLKDKSTDGVVLRKRSEFFTMPVYAAPPAQGIDMGQLRELLNSAALFYDKGFEGRCRIKIDAALALIDQRDAAPGVGNG